MTANCSKCGDMSFSSNANTTTSAWNCRAGRGEKLRGISELKGFSPASRRHRTCATTRARGDGRTTTGEDRHLDPHTLAQAGRDANALPVSGFEMDDISQAAGRLR